MLNELNVSFIIQSFFGGGSLNRGGSWSGIHVDGKMKGKVSEKKCFKRGVFLVRGQFTWKYES